VDELSLGLSPRALTEVLDALVDTCSRRGTALLLVDQNVRALAPVCERMYVLTAGATREIDPKDPRIMRDWVELL
jgi:branched-chain amino acid transport system ATP-binding protein